MEWFPSFKRAVPSMVVLYIWFYMEIYHEQSILPVMKNLLLIIFLVLNVAAFAQQTPVVKIGDTEELTLTTVSVDVEIIGNFVLTTYDMVFYNGLDRTLEGELSFPLGEGQSVSNFAMDMNGTLREAVVVEKELARVAYESTIRQNIDPGLLEKTEGNNYKARVYPILPKSNKHIVITYEQELTSFNGVLTYELPLRFKQSLDVFSLQIHVATTDTHCVIKDNPYKALMFKQVDNATRASVVVKNHKPSAPVILEIPTPELSGNVLSYGDYFYAYQALEPVTRRKSAPKKITILWDASFSLKHRKIEQEINLLKRYIRRLGTVEVQFFSFNNRIQQQKNLVLTPENFNLLEELIRSVQYDGGTSLGLFANLKINSDEMLLFTDGLANLGDFSSDYKKSIYTINSTVSAAHEELKRISRLSGGSYLNLVRRSAEDALPLLTQETYQFLGIKANEAIREVYPKEPTNVTSDFAISGKFSHDTTLELLFGYQGKVTKTIPLTIKKRASSVRVRRLWAKKKLDYLNRDKEKQREIIVEFAKQHHLLSDFTSMLILDRIEDYVRYRIEPPRELKEAYKNRLSDVEQAEAQQNAEIMKRKAWLMDEYRNLYDWYDVRFPVAELAIKKPPITTEAIQNNPRPSQTVSEQQHVTTQANSQQNDRATFSANLAQLDPTKPVVSGTVVDENGLVLPGVNVWVEATHVGTITDFDGRYALNANEGDELQFSFVGYTSKAIVVGNTSQINMALHEDHNVLEEVVVVGYATREKRSVTGSATTVISQALAGKVPGVAIERQVGANDTIRHDDVEAPEVDGVLYIVNGVPIDHNPLAELKATEIESIQVLKPAHATQIYGLRAANGMMVITTKKGLETNWEEIEAFNLEIEDKIELKSWNPDRPYIHLLAKEKSVKKAYQKYLEIRSTYGNSPSFYLDVSDFFDKKGSTELAITVLTNLIEIDLANHELLKALAYKLSYFKQYDLAVVVNEKILEIRPEDPQSYRDLALAYEEVGAIQKSFDLLIKFYNGALLSKDMDERYYGIEQIAFVELSRLVANYKDELTLSKKQLAQFKKISLDVRVVIDWNHNDTDIDLWVIDPNGERAFYSNPLTKIGGRMSEDLTDGYGPEEFMLKNAIKGEYTVMVDYFADNVQKISGPTVLKVNLFTNYGKKNERKKVVVVRLEHQEDEMEVANLTF